jgi:hypothetical protein
VVRTSDNWSCEMVRHSRFYDRRMEELIMPICWIQLGVRCTKLVRASCKRDTWSDILTRLTLGYQSMTRQIYNQKKKLNCIN